MNEIIFVCHGNICRSPAGEYILKDRLARFSLQDRFTVCSRAVSYEEIGNDIYPPMKRALSRAGIPFGPHHAQIINAKDFARATRIYYMDENNEYRLRSILGSGYQTKCRFIGEGVPGILEIEDPWYTGRFDEVVRQIGVCVDHILEDLIRGSN